MFYYYYSTTYCTYLMECVSLKKPTSFSVIITSINYESTKYEVLLLVFT